ncbi:hypothetical protein MOA67_gp120 [Klebsiella phage KpLz-2_45]|uniref:hypothetical protein n=1 Tax=Klebsiella phage KpLz-2_45 TaxID=2698923 RepID=UPI001F1384B3|nr:hypothetical protein MOA67_gp120 [Klebsiella phage KpLz-2_45]UKS71986.1 hypothetical protein KpLz245_1200 [Klebsiella phage KpLz-2_45]
MPAVKNQPVYLYNGVKRTVPEIVEITGMKRITVYQRIKRALVKTPGMKDVGPLFVNLVGYKKRLYPVLSEVLTLSEIVVRYRLDYRKTQSSLFRGDSVLTVLERRAKKSRPEIIHPKTRAKLRASFSRIKNRSGKSLTLPVHWTSYRKAFDEIGYPREETDFLWIEKTDEPLNAMSCYWAPAERRADYTRYTTQPGRIASINVEWEGQQVSVAELAREKAIPYTTLLYRVKKGWPKEDWFNPIDESCQRLAPRVAKRTVSTLKLETV